MKKKLMTEEVIKILNLSEGYNFTIRRLFNNQSYTHEEWVKKLKKNKIL